MLYFIFVVTHIHLRWFATTCHTWFRPSPKPRRGTWRLLVNARILTNLVTSQCELVTIFFSGMRSYNYCSYFNYDIYIIWWLHRYVTGRFLHRHCLFGVIQQCMWTCTCFFCCSYTMTYRQNILTNFIHHTLVKCFLTCRSGQVWAIHHTLHEYLWVLRGLEIMWQSMKGVKVEGFNSQKGTLC